MLKRLFYTVVGVAIIIALVGAINSVIVHLPAWRQLYLIRQDMKEAERQEAIRAQSEVPGTWIAAVDVSAEITDGKKTVTTGFIRRELWFTTDKAIAAVFDAYRVYFPGLNDGWVLGRADAATGNLFFYNDGKGQQLSVAISPRDDSGPGSQIYINWITVREIH
jgi:hypothetical protein